MQNNQQLNEGLRSGDLRNFVNDVFTVDQYRSKMGEDRDIVVLGFRVREKHPAIDLMEFIEKGYDFILDADMSAGEEHDGKYQVFAELERTPKLPEQLAELLGGVGQLCDCRSWKYKYQKSVESISFDKDTVTEHIPTTPLEYESKILEFKNNDVKEFFDQGSVDIELDESNTLTFSKPYSGSIQAKFVSIGDYNDVKQTLPGKLSLDESSQSQCLFLTKYLGKYDIDKIGTKFLIRNGSKAVVIEKERW
jgi:hypothetical protein